MIIDVCFNCLVEHLQRSKALHRLSPKTQTTLDSRPVGCWSFASLQQRMPTPQELCQACSRHQRRPGTRTTAATARVSTFKRIENPRKMKNRMVREGSHMGFPGISRPFPTAVQRNGSVFPGPFEQILHHFVGTLLLRRPNDLLATSF